MDELEAVRLADFEGIYQEDAAKRMNVSRQTFGNIIKSAHLKIADALVNAKALKIEGGVVTMVEKLFNCSDCKHEWSVPHGMGRPNECPQCGGSNVRRSFDDRGRGRRGGSGQGRGRLRRGRGNCPDCSSVTEDVMVSLKDETSSSKEELVATEKRLSE
jgi:DNA-binding XRE family transcriptional regulator